MTRCLLSPPILNLLLFNFNQPLLIYTVATQKPFPWLYQCVFVSFEIQWSKDGGQHPTEVMSQPEWNLLTPNTSGLTCINQVDNAFII